MPIPARSGSLREKFNISRFAIAYPWLTIGFWIAVTVAGILAFSSLKYALFPDITFPVVVVNASAPLQTALDTETKLTNPIEQQLKTLPGVDDFDSSTYPGQTAVNLSFEVGTNLEKASRSVKTALQKVKLPSGASFEVLPLNLNESAAVSYAIVSRTKTLTELKKVAQDQIVPAISRVPGVLKVGLLGSPEPPDVTNAETQSRREEDVAKIKNQKSKIKNSAALYPAKVQFNGTQALAIQVIKKGEANTLDVVRQVEKAVRQLRTQRPDVQIFLAATQAEYIQEATNATIDALALAVVLSVIVIFPFLWNWQATLISALAIPTSLLGTFIVMAIGGFNLETITLLALALVVGIIVDDAIVDVENIARHLEAGEPPRQAAIAATDEIGLTVTAATLTIVAVFLPVGLMGGVVGQFFKPFGITVSAAVITSLLVARTLSPLLAVYWLKPTPTPPENHRWDGFVRAYRRLLNWSLKARYLVLGLAIVSLVVGIGLVPLIPKGFIPKLDRGEFNITFTAPLPAIPAPIPEAGQDNGLPPSAADANLGAQGLTNLPFPLPNPLEDSFQVAKKLEAVVRRSPDVQNVFTIVGSRWGEPNKGTLYVKLKHDRSQTTSDLQEKFRQALPKLPGVTVGVEDIQFVDTGGEKPLQLKLQGNDLAALNQTAKQVKDQVQKLPGFVDVTTTGEINKTDTVLQIEHADGKRVAHVTANLNQNLSVGEATDQMVKIARSLLTPGVEIDLGGDSARIGEIFNSFGSTLGLGVLCIIIVLLLLFRSWTDPLVIAFSLPLSLVGAMLALLIAGSEFGMIAVIGIIFLMGLTNKNAILIVDYINQLRRSGISRTDAILKAAPIRLRPILMTTAATILGMMPIALGLGAGAELRAPMAITIIGGLITSTLLSLIVVPVLYTLLDDLKRIGKPQRSH
ncbi:MAG: efflux RND transporter permease subunit [Scytolyngbya sp. HA4215-MV1]|jgi:multidrug efflux pump subunit AcrB|nr:efflux RND transporter permease subunit [Scytolyngbya sp. HA4215-MV1]